MGVIVENHLYFQYESIEMHIYGNGRHSTVPSPPDSGLLTVRLQPSPAGALTGVASVSQHHWALPKKISLHSTLVGVSVQTMRCCLAGSSGSSVKRKIPL